MLFPFRNRHVKDSQGKATVPRSFRGTLTDIVRQREQFSVILRNETIDQTQISK